MEEPILQLLRFSSLTN